MVTLKEKLKNKLVVEIRNEILEVEYNENMRIIRIDGGGHKTITPGVNTELQRLVYQQA